MTFLSKKKNYAIAFALTFAIYVFYDSVRLFQISIPPLIQEGSFLLATASALFAIFDLYKKK